MTGAQAAAPSPAAFTRLGALALVGGGFALFLTMLWLIGIGADFGAERGRGEAHAAANGLNGYSGLVRLTEAQGYAVNRSRSLDALTTDGLLVLTPTRAAAPETIAGILTRRATIGPTLVIMPKWLVSVPAPNMPPETQKGFKRGWVTLEGVQPSSWPAALPAPYTFTHAVFPEQAAGHGAAPDTPPRPVEWRGMGLSGTLPAPGVLFAGAAQGMRRTDLIVDAGGRVLAFTVAATRDGAADANTHRVLILAEPDLANNYGLADPARAAAAIALVDTLTAGGEIENIVFDMTLNGFGASENLLTLAFRPPFLAATLSLLAALMIVGWRAFLRFGPAAAPAGPDIAFGKAQLIANGAGLILRARRFGLLGKPYAALAARKLSDRLGLARPDPAAIDAALARRLPGEEPFTRRAARLEAARKPADLVAAAQSLDDLAARLTQGPQ